MNADNVHHIDPLTDRAVRLILAYVYDDMPIVLLLDSPLAAKVRELDPDVEVFDEHLLDRHWEAMTADQRLITRQAVIDVVEDTTGEPCSAVRFHRDLCSLLLGIEAGVVTPPWCWGWYEVVAL